MRIRIILLYIISVLLFAKASARDSGTYYVYFTDGRVWGYPKEYVKDMSKDDEGYTLTLVNDSIISWLSAEINDITEEEPVYPQFTRFKLDDKLNDQLFRDVEANVSPNEVTATVSGIGKWLTPLFALDMPDAVAYVNGDEQMSGQSRLRFADKVTYTLECPKYKCLSEGNAAHNFQMVPMVREVSVCIDWLTDHADTVPRIDINIDSGKVVTSKDDYLNAYISFKGNGVWDDYDFQDSVKIKGRGNASWNHPKKPYRLKFDEAVKPFGMKKGKNWNLIAQANKGSLMTNPVAHKISRMVGLQAANDVVPIELYMNGEYRGSYFFTQKVGMSNNSVDFDDESKAVLIELDTYSEPGKFYSTSYGLPVNIKSPEFGEDETMLDYYAIQEEFNRFETAVYTQSNYERFVDMDMLVRYMLVYELVRNRELQHPKSAFLSREDMTHMVSRYVFGPAWDFDWGFGYDGGSLYCRNWAESDLFSPESTSPGNLFYSTLLRSSEWVKFHYYRLWVEFVDKHLEELIDFVDEYYAYARSSFVHNQEIWGDGANYALNVAYMKYWLRTRANYIKENLASYAPDAQEPFSYGDLNGDGAIHSDDVECMLFSLLGVPVNGVIFDQADADADGKVSLNDLVWVNLLAQDVQESEAFSRQRRDLLWTPDEDELDNVSDFDIDDMMALVPSQECISQAASLRVASETCELGVSVDDVSGELNISVSVTNSTPYMAFSMDFVIPEIFLTDCDVFITPHERVSVSSFIVMGSIVADGVYRVIGYSTTNTAIAGVEGELFTLSLGDVLSMSSGTYTVDVIDAQFVTEKVLEEYSSDVHVAFDIELDTPTQLNPTVVQHFSCPADIYDLSGRLVRKQVSSFSGLSKGVYIVNNRKLVW